MRDAARQAPLGAAETSRNGGKLRGMRYDEVIDRLERAPQITVIRKDRQTLRLWREKRYSVTLLFDGSGVCLGVEDEEI